MTTLHIGQRVRHVGTGWTGRVYGVGEMRGVAGAVVRYDEFPNPLRWTPAADLREAREVVRS